MAAGLTDAQIEEFKEAFTLYDHNMDGTITSKDLGNVLKAIGQNPSDEETRNLVERVGPFNIFGIFDQTKDKTCEKLKIFLLRIFYVKSILAILEFQQILI